MLILEALSQDPAATAKIMYKTFLSFDQLQKYLTTLESNDFLRYDRKVNKYRTTEKGLRFLAIYNNPKLQIEKEDQISNCP